MHRSWRRVFVCLSRFGRSQRSRLPRSSENGKVHIRDFESCKKLKNCFSSCALSTLVQMAPHAGHRKNLFIVLASLASRENYAKVKIYADKLLIKF